jgi:hypothetical protein
MPESKVTIAGKEYEISPLKMKHIRAITEMVKANAPSGVYDSLSRFFPYITASIKEKNPDFTQEMIEDGTLDEINTVVTTVIDYSGIKITAKSGEAKPVQDSIGDTSTENLPPQPAGTTVQ